MHALAGPLDLLVVDYHQLIGGPEESDYSRVTAAGRALKEWAKAKSVPVILLSQVTDVEPGHVPQPPMLGQTRLSRDVEMDCDWELAVHRAAQYRSTEDESRAVFRLLKQRNGWTGELEMGWDGPSTRFYDR
jgi:replicative DNA helicase